MATALIKAKARDESAGAMLDAIREILGLSESDLADLFRVRAPSVYGWRAAGIPDARRASVERILDLATVLRREIKATRIPQIVRTPDDWLAARRSSRRSATTARRRSTPICIGSSRTPAREAAFKELPKLRTVPPRGRPPASHIVSYATRRE